jgi:hypothetical protein
MLPSFNMGVDNDSGKNNKFSCLRANKIVVQNQANTRERFEGDRTFEFPGKRWSSNLKFDPTRRGKKSMNTKIGFNPHLIYQDWILTEIQFNTNLWLHARTKSSQIQLGMAAQITLSGVNGTLENDALRGLSRRESLMRIVGNRQYSEDQILEMMERKNRYYVESIESVSPKNLLPGAIDFLDELRAAGIKIALGSASKNARAVIERLGIGDRIDALAISVVNSFTLL